MNIAFWIMVVAAIIWVILALTEKRPDVQDAAKWTALFAMLAWLLGGVR